MQALVAAPSGQHLIRVQGQGPDPQQLGQMLAQQAMEQGAGHILARLQAGLPLRGRAYRRHPPPGPGPLFHDMLVDLGAQPLLIPAIQIEPAADMAPLHDALHQLSTTTG
jgi:hypothetical protein